MNIKRELGIWTGSLVGGALTGMMGLAGADLGITGAKRNISVMQEIPFSEVVSPYPEWLPIVVALFMFVVGVSMVQGIIRLR